MESSWLVGRNPVREALRAERAIDAIMMLENAHGSGIGEIIKLCKEQGIPVKQVHKSRLDEVSEGRPHQGVAASVAAHAYADIDELLARGGDSPLLIVLDHLQDPHNVGAILRTAEAAGALGVIMPRRRAVGLTATVAKASAGAIEHIPVARVGSIGDTLEMLKKRGYWIFGLDGSATTHHTGADFTGPVALVIGSEGEGLSTRTQRACDVLVRLPMLGKVESLNASVAAGICLYEILRQRDHQQQEVG